MRRARLIAALSACVLAAAGCGGEDPDRPGRTTVLDGVRTTTIFTPAGDPEDPPVVLFLHGWGAIEPRQYKGWIDHLVARGNVVVFPRYQDSFLYPPTQVLGNVIKGFEAALEEVDVDEDSLVIAGHSAGGALSADFAAIARQAGLPQPRAIFAAYPGRFLPGWPARIPPIDPALIPPSTRVVALVGERDTVVPDSVAEAIVDGARRVPRDRRTLIRVTDDAVDTHNGPMAESPAARRTFWRAFDDVVAQARRQASTGDPSQVPVAP